ncbi:MAG: amino acid racemase [Candidatus Bipolaricaulota bacterium]|nr:MAG: amino acid racemase [Candidatus Bipolaricaulota bacterium]
MTDATAPPEEDRRPIIGILGGMGPEATAAFYTRLIDLTAAHRDQDHLHVIIDADPAIPDRTAALLDGGESPVPAMRAGIARLVAAGADLIAIPCNTAHVWIDDLRLDVEVPIVDMIRETARAASNVLPRGAVVGLLASTGTVRSAVYDRALEVTGLTVLHPAEAEQDEVMGAISRIKAGERDAPRDALRTIAHHLIAEGAVGLILGCTEIPLVFPCDAVPVPVFDSLDILTRRTVARVGVTLTETP